MFVTSRRSPWLFSQSGTVGLVRMPDLFLSISASSKGATLGVICLMLATALYFGDLGVTSRARAVSTIKFAVESHAARLIA